MQVFDFDGVRTIHDHSFSKDPQYVKAYRRGIRAAETDYKWYWRVHVGLWAAQSAAKLEGDFVELGVNRGFMASSIMDLLDWNSLDRDFYLLDTFAGVDENYLSEADKEGGVTARNEKDIASGFYTFDVEAVRRNFSEWPRARIVVGSVPETLVHIESQKIAFMHIDLNCSLPEVAALEHLWDRLTPGAFILLDDYAYRGYASQKAGMDDFARRYQIPILSLPTGQGLMIKPAVGV